MTLRLDADLAESVVDWGVIAEEGEGSIAAALGDCCTAVEGAVGIVADPEAGGIVAEEGPEDCSDLILFLSALHDAQ